MCQPWNERWPHDLEERKLRNPGREGLGKHNYCRNPRGKRARPWCYTTLKRPVWQYCDIVICNQKIKVGEEDTWNKCHRRLRLWIVRERLESNLLTQYGSLLAMVPHDLTWILHSKQRKTEREYVIRQGKRKPHWHDRGLRKKRSSNSKSGYEVSLTCTENGENSL